MSFHMTSLWISCVCTYSITNGFADSATPTQYANVTSSLLLFMWESETIKEGISGYGNLQTTSTDKWATSKSTQLSTKIWVKLLLLLENALKLNFWGPLTSWKFEPSPRPHTHSDPTINKHTEQVKKLHFDLSWHALNSVIGQKLSTTLKSKDEAYCPKF